MRNADSRTRCDGVTVRRVLPPASRFTFHVSRITHHASRPTPHSALRNPHSRGVALVITLVLLSVITFMTVAFLVLSRSQHGSVTTETDQAGARFAADAARERAITELIVPILASTNEFNYGLLVSTNYINADGFLTTGSPNGFPYTSPTNVNYNYPGGAPVTGNDALQNIANLLYNPRPPVFIVTNPFVANSNDFRFYLDLNRNGAYDPSGLQPEVVRNSSGALGFYDLNGAFVPYRWPPPPNIVSNFVVGDPEWIGVLRRPEFAHSADNPFIYRYAYFVVPAGQTLDLNCIHNYAKRLTATTPWADGFLRNQGVLTAEINLAAFLADLNTNLWPSASPSEFGFAPYSYSTNLVTASTGAAADDAASLLRYRYAANVNSLANVVNLFGYPRANVFTNLIDAYSEGPLMFGTSWPPPGVFNPNPGRVSGNSPWAGADNPNHFYSTQDLFDRTKIPKLSPWTLPDRLLMAGTNLDSYNRYTFYRLESQLGTDSAPEPGSKINVNYCNVDAKGYLVPNAATNFAAWYPAQFFTNAAIRLLADAGYTVGAFNSTSNVMFTNSPFRHSGHQPPDPAWVEHPLHAQRPPPLATRGQYIRRHFQPDI